MQRQNYYQIGAVIALFALLGILLFHGITSINNDIGRHLKLGEIIWKTTSIPDTNFFSYTVPEFPFMNHHWLSEVIMYGMYVAGGFKLLIIAKIVLAIGAFYAVWNAVKQKSFFFGTFGFITGISIFIERSEMRPEIFSYLFLGLFLFILFRAKYDHNLKWLWILPALQLLWVNTHIFFFLGPLLYVLFLIDRFLNKKFTLSLVWPGSTMLVINMLNPQLLQGVLEPFRILREYGYQIIENQSILTLFKVSAVSVSAWVFLVAVVGSAVLIMFNIRAWRSYAFEFVLAALFAYAGFRMIRNIPLFGLAIIPLWSVWGKNIRIPQRVANVVPACVIAFAVFIAGSHIAGAFYPAINSPKLFGFTTANGAERAVAFIKERNLKGPIFNNFDIGGYVIWKLFPDERVFVDNRPEAYPVEFFEKIYKPMQSNPSVWKEVSDYYKFQMIFFTHGDITPWAQAFLERISKDPEWNMAYLNEDVVVFAKEGDSLTPQNAIERTTNTLRESVGDPFEINWKIARFFYQIRWADAALHFSTQAYALDADSAHANLILGLSYSLKQTKADQERAARYVRFALEHGLESADYYVILAALYANADDLANARWAVKQALALDRNHPRAKEISQQLEQLR